MIHGIGNYVVEGLEEMDEAKIDKIMNDMTESIKEMTNAKGEGHLAIKFTGLLSIDIMTRLSAA